MVDSPYIILVRPQLSENIGMVARAMANGGLEHLRLVAPKEDWLSAITRATAAGADFVLDSAQVYATTQEAIEDLHTVYATTARPRDVVKPFLSPEGVINDIQESPLHQSGILFGPERAGLEQDDLVFAHKVVQIPVCPKFSSYNLSQAVLVLSYEWVKAQSRSQDHLRLGKTVPATQGEVDELLDHLFRELERTGFLRHPGLKPTMMRNIANIFQRIHFTEQEVRTFHGVIHALAHPYKDNKTQ